MYYIYHIPGVKVGCTRRDPEVRVREQGYSEFEILESWMTPDIATRRERELQEEYGYSKDKSNYYQTVYVVGATAHSTEALSKRSKSRTGKHAGTDHYLHKNPRKGEDNNSYDTGREYLEVTTGFSGKVSEMSNRFNYKSKSAFINQVNKNRPVQKGPNKGLHFRVVS